LSQHIKKLEPGGGPPDFDSAAVLAKIARTVPGVICSFRLDADGNASMPYASPAFESVYGFSADAVKSDFSPVFERIHPEDLGHVHATIMASAQTLHAWRDAFRYRHPTKGEIWIEGHSMPEREADGSTIWYGFIQDITDLKSQEGHIKSLDQNLTQRLEELQTIFDTVPIGLSIADDVTGQHIRGNPASEALLGLGTGAELSMRSSANALRIFHQDGSPLPVDDLPMQRAVRGEQVEGQVIELSRPDGRHVHVLCYATPLFDADRKPRGAIGAFMDISPLREIERALARNERFKQSILDALPASIAVLDAQGTIVAVNQPWLRFAEDNGGSATTAIGVGVNYLDVCRQSIVTHSEHAANALAGIQAVVQGRQDVFEMEYPCDSPHEARWFSMQVVRPSVDIEGAIVIHLNITERKKAVEEIARQLRNLESANAELERFNRVAVGRELRMIELKKMINQLCAEVGQPPRFIVNFDEDHPVVWDE
jgi:PAS domain S-box-containing protein